MPHAESPPPTQTPLYVNDGVLSPSSIGRLRPSSPSEPLPELRRRYAEDGYLYLKNLLPRSFVLSTRAQYFTFLAPSGVLEPNTPFEAGIFNSSRSKDDFPGIGTHVAGDNPDLPFVKLALEAHRQDWYAETFCKHPALVDFIARFTGWGADKTRGYKRTLLRNNVPGQKAIGVHYDQIFLRHGDPDSVTAWVPIGDVTVNGGGLIYLEKGHELGAEQEARFRAEAEAQGLSEEERRDAFNRNMAATGLLDEGSGPKGYGERFGRRWLVTDYEAGDVVLHNAFSIHASTVNHDESGRIRIGTDIRFVDQTGNWDTRWGEDFYRMDDGL